MTTNISGPTIPLDSWLWGWSPTRFEDSTAISASDPTERGIFDVGLNTIHNLMNCLEELQAIIATEMELNAGTISNDKVKKVFKQLLTCLRFALENANLALSQRDFELRVQYLDYTRHWVIKRLDPRLNIIQEQYHGIWTEKNANSTSNAR